MASRCIEFSLIKVTGFIGVVPLHDAAEPLAVSLGISVAHAPGRSALLGTRSGAAAASSRPVVSSDDPGHNRCVTRNIPFNGFLMYRML